MVTMSIYRGEVRTTIERDEWKSCFGEQEILSVKSQIKLMDVLNSRFEEKYDSNNFNKNYFFIRLVTDHLTVFLRCEHVGTRSDFLYDKVLDSGLREDVLKMYFLSASLTGQSYDMGRMMAFAAGWLENQSIWMHTSYKLM